MESLSQMKFINFLNDNKFFIIFLILGLVFFIHPMLSSNFDLMIGDKISTLYNNYVLEHSYLWLMQDKMHPNFWSAPFGVQENVIANSDALIGILPIYWFIRSLIQNPFTSFQILFIVLCILNYSTFYYFLYKQLKFSNFASAFASFIFAFNLLRYFRSFEIGYFSQFLTILAIIFLFKTSIENKRIINHVYYLIASIFIILQFYTCFSLGFFAIFFVIFGLILGLIPKSSRDVIVDYLKNFWGFILFYSFVIGLMLLPMSYHFSLLGEENVKTLSNQLETIFSSMIWIKNISFLDNMFLYRIPFVGYDTYQFTNCSVGVFLIVFSMFAIWKMAKYRGALILSLNFIYFVSCNEIAIGFWRICYYLFIGTEGLSAFCHIVFIGLIIFSIGCGYLIQYFEQNVIKNKIITNILMIFIVLLLIFEQFPINQDPNSYWRNYVLSKKELQKEIDGITKQVSADIKYINVTCKEINKEKYGVDDIKNKKKLAKKYSDLISMYSAMKLGIYSLNDYFEQENSIKQPKNAQNIVHIVDFDKI